MTPEPADEFASLPRDGALVRVIVRGGGWTRTVPRVPPGHDVSVSFSSAASVTRHGHALRERGFRVIDGATHPDDDGAGVADFVVPRALIESAHGWWSLMAARAAGTYRLALGPVVLTFAPVLRAHLRGSGRLAGERSRFDN